MLPCLPSKLVNSRSNIDFMPSTSVDLALMNHKVFGVACMNSHPIFLFSVLKYRVLFLLLAVANNAMSQLIWHPVDSLYQPLPVSVQIFRTTEKFNNRPMRAFYAKVAMYDRNLTLTVDTSYLRRLTPSIFYEKNQQPLLVVNGTYFSFQTHKNLSLVIKDKKLLAHAPHAVFDKADSLYHYVFRSALGISRKRQADVAWLYIDTLKQKVYALPYPLKKMVKKSSWSAKKESRINLIHPEAKRWRVHTAIGGGPVLLEHGKVKITNNEERMFSGNAVNDLHPRTAIGYTSDGFLIIMAVEGRNLGIAEGVSLNDLAIMLKDLGCVEALNLDGGGSSCLLVNGKETIKPSDKEGQRPIPAVFIIR